MGAQWPSLHNMEVASCKKTLCIYLNTFYSGLLPSFFLTDKRGYLLDEGFEIAFTYDDSTVHDSAESTTGYRVILKRGMDFYARHRFAFNYPQPLCSALRTPTATGNPQTAD